MSYFNTTEKMTELENKYSKLGISITSNRPIGDNRAWIYSIKLNFEPKVWIDLCNTEGEYLPSCCANISRVRDVLMDTIRDNYVIRAYDLKEIYWLLKEHDCEENTQDNPVYKLMQIWETIQEDVQEDTPCTSDNADIKDVVLLIAGACREISWSNLTTGSGEPEDRTFERLAVTSFELSKVLPALHTLYKYLENSESISPVEGWAICDSKGELVSTRVGYSVFRTRELADKVVNSYRHNFTVRPVKITVKNGLEFLDV